MITAQSAGFKEMRMSAGNKENFVAGESLRLGRGLPDRKMLRTEGMEVRFAEPYSPEDEFRPVPLPMGIDFLAVSTGPPWSIGDDIEISRRKEMDHPRQITHLEITRPSEVPTSISIIPPEIPFVPQVPLIQDTLSSNVLLVMEPSDETLAQYRNFTHLKIAAETTVPLTYLRLKIPVFYRDLFLNEKSASHTLHLKNLRNETAVMPVHDLVLVVQCLNLRQIITLQTLKTRTAKPSLMVSNVPDLDSFGILLKWLYTNDEDELYQILSTSQLDKRELICGFALNCRFWGIVDSRVSAVIRALLHDLGYGY
jgi:hypothetical protein